jgi:hypothetical protein
MPHSLCAGSGLGGIGVCRCALDRAGCSALVRWSVAAALRCPARTLELASSDRGLELCRMIVRSPVAKHVEVVELPKVELPQEAITLLVENRAKFERLAVLRIENVRANERDRLRAAGYPVQTSPAKNGDK